MEIVKFEFSKEDEETRKILRKVQNTIKACIEHRGDIAGFAFVVWGKDAGAVVRAETLDSSAIPAVLLPAFVSSCLTWNDFMNDVEKLISPPSPKGA